MSESLNSPSKSNLEFLRKEAKSLLKLCRSGEAAVISRLRSVLPRLENLGDTEVALQIQLADVHQAIARERGYQNWAKLKHDDSAIEAFLVAIRGGALKDAQTALATLPEMADESIHAACAIGDPEALERHLLLDPKLIEEEHRRWPPLFYACASPMHRVSARQSAGVRECVQLLLQRGASPNTSILADANDPGSELSAAQRAMMSANMPVMMLLLQQGAKLDPQKWLERSKQQAPAMSSGFSQYFQKPEVRAQFQERMASIQKSAQDPEWGPGKWWFYMRPELPPASTPMFRAIVDAGVDINRWGDDGRTMLHHAAQAGTVELIDLLLDRGADIHSRTPDGRTALVLATRSGKNLNVDALLAHGATTVGLRPIDQLIGACIRADGADAKALVLANPKVAQMAAPEDAKVLIRAAAMNILLQARLMLECGFDPGVPDEAGITPLHAAAWHGNVEMVGLLLKYHAPLETRDLTYGSSPLAWAAHGAKHCRDTDENHQAVIHLLLDSGAHYEAAVSRSGVRPEQLASPGAAAILRERFGIS